MFQLILITIVICGIAMTLLSVRVILKKGGRFSQAHSCKFEPRVRKLSSRSKHGISR